MNYLKSLSIAYYIGMALFLIGIILQLNHSEFGIYCLGFGLIPILGIRVYNWSISEKERKRVHTIFVVSALFLLVAVVAVLFHKNYWMLFIFIAAVLDSYISFRNLF